MSYDEWLSRDGRARVRLHSDAKMLRFDMVNGDVVVQHENCLLEVENLRDGLREIIVFELGIVRQEGTDIFFVVRGRRGNRTEPLPTRHDTPVPRRTRRPIGVQEDR